MSSSEERRVDEAVAWIQSELLDPVGSVTIVGELVDIRHSKAGAWGEIATRDDDHRLVARFPWIARWGPAQQLQGYRGRNVALTGPLTAHPLYGPLRLSVETVRILDRPAAPDIDQIEAAAAAQARLDLPNKLRRVGIVAPSAASAGIGDFYQALGPNPGFLVEEHRSPMAGPAAGAHIARAILIAAHSCDLVIALRGGGAAADLAAWDSADVVDAIGTARVPVIVAVGHTRDRHRADEAARLSLPTPTAAGSWLRAHVII